jgi:sulfatase modifying factor 1
MNAARLLLTLIALLLSVPAHAVTIDMVTVGDPGNANDPASRGGRYGAVNCEYQIGKYEVTIGQYADFLNAAAKADPYNLYSAYMASELFLAGISRSGTSGGYTYSVIGPFGTNPFGASSPGNRPISAVNWFDAARFANWMHNGQGSGSTETGAYTLNGATSGTPPAKNPDAKFYIPTTSEWYKAAYYSPLLNSESGGYYTYATQSNTPPGNTIGIAANQANKQSGGVFSVTQSAVFAESQNYLTDVGAFTNSASFYGTFDQSGNVAEWTDGLFAAPDILELRGGWWGSGELGTSSSTFMAWQAGLGTGDTGFRLASPVPVPEPSTWVMGVGSLACGGLFLRRRRAINSLTVFAFLTVASLTANQTFAGAITVSPDGVITNGTSQLVAVSGTAPNGNTWASYVTGTNPVAYFDIGTGSLMFDPKGKSASVVDFRYGYIGEIGGGTVGPYVFATGTGNPGSVSTTSIERTMPAGTWASILTFPVRFAGAVSVTNTPTLATSGGNIASDNGWFNKPWSFGAVAPSVTQAQMFSTTAGQGFRAVASSSNPAPVNLLGYGNGIGMFLWLEAGVAGNQYGPVIPIQPVPEPAAIVLTGLGVATLLVRHTHWHRRRVNESETP